MPNIHSQFIAVWCAVKRSGAATAMPFVLAQPLCPQSPKHPPDGLLQAAGKIDGRAGATNL